MLIIGIFGQLYSRPSCRSGTSSDSKRDSGGFDPHPGWGMDYFHFRTLARHMALISAI